jgi:phosphoribosylanthranilate isomerase
MIRCLFFPAPRSIEAVSPTRIKICGITSVRDARVAVDCGTDAIGLVFYPKSPRAVTIARAAEIAASVPPFVTVVALLVDESPERVGEILAHVPVDLLQFHGEESAAFCAQFQRPWIKAVRVRPGVDIAAAAAACGAARGILLDNWQAGVPGGTGKAFDWTLAAGEWPLPVVLAGGLDSGNVGSAIAALAPAAVDVSGGVERVPGEKDPARIAAFVAAVRAADQLRNEMQHDD